MSFQENQSDSGDGFGGDGEAIGSIISPQHSLQHAPTQHEPHKLSTGPAGMRSDRTKKTQEATTAGITPSVPVKPTEYIPGNENGPILIDTLSGRNELVNASNINREVPNLFPIIGVPKGIPAGIAIPPAVPLDLPTLGGNKKQKRLQVEIFQQQNSTSRRQHTTTINQSIPLQQQFISHDRSDLPLELSDPQNIIHISSQFYHAGDYGMMIKSLEVLDRHNMSAKYECHPLAVGRAVSNLGNAYQSMGSLRKAKEYYEIALGHAIYGSDQQGQSRACGNIGNIYMTMKEPVKAVHYYTETLRLSSDRSTKTTGYHNRGCARFEVAECIMQGKKPKELVRSSTRDSVYRTLTIKLTDEVITTHPVQETSLDYSAHSVSESEEMIEQVVATPSTVSGESLDIVTSEEVTRLTEALPFYETAKANLIEAVEAHERGIQNVKGSHESLNLSTLLFENNSKSFYKLQETSVEIGRVHLRLSELGIMDSESQEFKQALVFAEQARARTLGELLLQKKRASCSDLLAVSTPLGLSDIFKTVEKQKMPAVFLSYCLSKLLMWVLIPINGEVKMRCNTIQLRNEDFDNSSFELYIRYNLLQFLNQNEVHIFQRCAYEQESPFTVLYDVIARRIMEAFESLGASKVTEFIVIPDSVTHLMPFSPLINKQNWEFLGDRFRIRIVPSFLTQLIMSVTGNPIVEVPGDKSDFVVVGNPNIPPFELDSVQWNLGRLPYAEKEAVSVANIVGTTAVLREQATKQSVLYRLRSGKIIHLAAHGSANAGFLAFASSFPVPKSGIVNSEHILIFPKEIETLNISPALVVLSSCDSGRGQVKAEGVIGMARAFLSVGAQSVLVSLWRVPDESAHIFMQYFYQFLVNGLPSFHALQRSMQSLRCFHKYSHFVHWSGFQIIGKEITLHKSSNSQFPILKMIGEASIFPRQSVKEIGEGLLSGKTKGLSNVQVCYHDQ